jgi:hypothetical protein
MDVDEAGVETGPCAQRYLLGVTDALGVVRASLPGGAWVVEVGGRTVFSGLLDTEVDVPNEAVVQVG